MDNFWAKAVSKNDISIIIRNCKQGIGKCSIIDFISLTHYLKQGYVYFLLKDGTVVYIGASHCNSRIQQHQKDKDYDSFCYYMLNNYEYVHLETLLIRAFKPLYNKCNVAKSNTQLSKKVIVSQVKALFQG